jgi:hypothetical protein
MKLNPQELCSMSLAELVDRGHLHYRTNQGGVLPNEVSPLTCVFSLACPLLPKDVV